MVAQLGLMGFCNFHIAKILHFLILLFDTLSAKMIKKIHTFFVFFLILCVFFSGGNAKVLQRALVWLKSVLFAL